MKLNRLTFFLSKVESVCFYAKLISGLDAGEAGHFNGFKLTESTLRLRLAVVKSLLLFFQPKHNKTIFVAHRE